MGKSTSELCPGIKRVSGWEGDNYSVTISVEEGTTSGARYFGHVGSATMHVDPTCDANGKGTKEGVLEVFPGETKVMIFTPDEGTKPSKLQFRGSFQRIDLPAGMVDEVIKTNRAAIKTELQLSVEASLGKDSLAMTDVIKRSADLGIPFADEEFIPGSHLQHVDHHNHTLWKRAKDLFEDAKVLGSVNPNAIGQGKLGDCWLISALSCLAEHPHRVAKVFTGIDIDGDGIPDLPLSSVHDVHLYRMCLPYRVRVDDFFPCDLKTGKPLYASSKEGTIWSMLCEKAFAKIYGSYRSLASGFSRNAFQDLTGFPTGQRRFTEVSPGTDEADALWKDLVAFDRDHYLLSLSTVGKDVWSQRGETPPEDNLGLVTGHAYALLRVETLKSGERLVRIRNPWGRFEWKGEWSDDSDKWTPEIEEELGMTTAERKCEDGMFWMGFDDFLRHFRSCQYCDARPYHRLHWKSEFVTDVGKDCTETIRAPAFEIKFSEGRQRVWFGVHQDDSRGLGQCIMGMGMTIFRADGSSPSREHSLYPFAVRDCWHYLEFDGPATFVVTVTARGKVLEKLRQGETLEEAEREKHFEEIEGLFVDCATTTSAAAAVALSAVWGGVRPSDKLRAALLEIFWRMDKDLDEAMDENECGVFLAQLGDKSDLSKFDRTEKGLTRDGFLDACMSIALKRSPSDHGEEGMFEILEAFGYNRGLQLIHQRPFALTVHSAGTEGEVEPPKLLIWPAKHSYCKCYRSSSKLPRRPANVVDPSRPTLSSSGGDTHDEIGKSPAIAAASSGAGASDAGAGIAVPGFPSGFNPLGSIPVRVHLAKGDVVRFRRSLRRPVYGWGKGRLGEVGRISEVLSNKLRVDFPSHPNFMCRPFEVERATTLEIGDVVRIQPSVTKPKYGWGSVKHGHVGRVVELDFERNRARIWFEKHDNFLCTVDELEWVLDDLDPPEFSPGTQVRISRSCPRPRFGLGKAIPGAVGVVSEVDEDGDLSIDFPNCQGWTAHPSDVEIVGRMVDGDHVELVESLGDLPRGKVGVLLNVSKSCHVLFGDGKVHEVPRSAITHATHELEDKELVDKAMIRPGIAVRFQSSSYAKSQKLDNDQVGIVTSAKFVKDEWTIKVCFPGNPSWEGSVKRVTPVSCAAAKGDYVVLAPTLEEPAFGWGDKGPVKHGRVGTVTKVDEVKYRGHKQRAVYVDFGGESIKMLSAEVIASPRMP
jgi:hypothetical protein